jgi:hypothetical protein
MEARPNWHEMSPDLFEDTLNRMMPSDATPDDLLYLIFQQRSDRVMKRIQRAHRPMHREAWATLINSALLRLITLGDVRTESLFPEGDQRIKSSLMPPHAAASLILQFLQDLETSAREVFKIANQHHLIHIVRSSLPTDPPQ